VDPPAVRITGIRGSVDEGGLPKGPLKLNLQELTVGAVDLALQRVIPANAPVKTARFTPAGLRVEIELSLTTVRADVHLFATGQGMLGVEIVSVATDLLGVPTSLVAAAIREWLPPQPWLHQRPGTRWDVDLQALARMARLEIPPLAAVRGAAGSIELDFSRTRKGPPPPEMWSLETPLPTPEPPPQIGRLALCPACEEILIEQPPNCPKCGSAVRYCPECGASALPGAAVCSSKAKHPLAHRPAASDPSHPSDRSD